VPAGGRLIIIVEDTDDMSAGPALGCGQERPAWPGTQ
jgi:hypothetical protein